MLVLQGVWHALPSSAGIGAEGSSLRPREASCPPGARAMVEESSLFGLQSLLFLIFRALTEASAGMPASHGGVGARMGWPPATNAL
eukprot:scaffold1564_cov389-Prasinococcus_capsulatus_cf.AAC.16